MPDVKTYEKSRHILKNAQIIRQEGLISDESYKKLILYALLVEISSALDKRVYPYYEKIESISDEIGKRLKAVEHSGT